VCGKPRKAKSAGRSRVNDLGPVYPSSRSPLFSSASPTREPILFARNVSRNLESANQSDGCATRITANYRDKAASRRGTRRILDIYMLIIHYPDHNNTGTIAGELLRGRAVGREIRATSRDFRTAANPVARDAFVRGGGWWWRYMGDGDERNPEDWTSGRRECCSAPSDIDRCESSRSPDSVIKLMERAGRRRTLSVSLSSSLALSLFFLRLSVREISA